MSLTIVSTYTCFTNDEKQTEFLKLRKINLK